MNNLLCIISSHKERLFIRIKIRVIICVGQYLPDKLIVRLKVGTIHVADHGLWLARSSVPIFSAICDVKSFWYWGNHVCSKTLRQRHILEMLFRNMTMMFSECEKMLLLLKIHQSCNCHPDAFFEHERFYDCLTGLKFEHKNIFYHSETKFSYCKRSLWEKLLSMRIKKHTSLKKYFQDAL